MLRIIKSFELIFLESSAEDNDFFEWLPIFISFESYESIVFSLSLSESIKLDSSELSKESESNKLFSDLLKESESSERSGTSKSSDSIVRELSKLISDVILSDISSSDATADPRLVKNIKNIKINNILSLIYSPPIEIANIINLHIL